MKCINLMLFSVLIYKGIMLSIKLTVACNVDFCQYQIVRINVASYYNNCCLQCRFLSLQIDNSISNESSPKFCSTSLVFINAFQC